MDRVIFRKRLFLGFDRQKILTWVSAAKMGFGCLNWVTTAKTRLRPLTEKKFAAALLGDYPEYQNQNYRSEQDMPAWNGPFID